MYLIVVYDIEIDRVNKVHKFLRKYLFWRQNSVFEGEVSKAQIEQIKVGLNILDNKSNFQFKVLGIEKNLMSTIL